MAKPPATEKTISARHVQRCWNRLLHNVLTKGTTYIVTRKGEPVAAVVPLTVYSEWKQGRANLFDTIMEAQQRADLTAQDAHTLAQEAVQVVRAGNTGGDPRRQK
jgi:antitoxin (DNA-binding transcriptional repressor) of toxin-antitoxin stability system